MMAINPTSSTAEQVLEIGARLQHPPSRRLVQTAFKRELEAQLGLSTAMSWVDLAHTHIMIDGGIIPAESGRELLKALLQLQLQPADFVPDPNKGDLYTNREAWLLEHYPDSAAWLGAGRARREAITTAYQIKLRTGLLELTEALITTARVLLDKATQFSNALMPDYTYLQAAEPTSFGHYLLGFVYPLLRDLERLQAVYTRVNKSPAGCGSSNGSRLPQQREKLAKLLGFDGLVEHARDAMWQVDMPVEIAALCTTVLLNLDRLAEDLQIFTTEEFGLIELHDCHARASKIMPQKKNPYALTTIRSLTNTLLGTLTSSVALARTPSAQPDNRLVCYGMIPGAVEDCRDGLLLIAEVIELLSFNANHAEAKLTNSFCLATDLAEFLVLKCALNFREAHRLVGYLVHHCLEDGNLQRISAELLISTAAQLLGKKITVNQEVLLALSPEAAIAARCDVGGVATHAMQTMFKHCEQTLLASQTWHDDCQNRLTVAEQALVK